MGVLSATSTANAQPFLLTPPHGSNVPGDLVIFQWQQMIASIRASKLP